ncbi:acyl-CoA dehydrogenase family protein [Saccharopolyspora gloriosae]|uniref:acyl-CoA dehydrogenase family protein n=1 Tax=Saccharopolyspora gloriosae TaxID=455344 RepID=UPI001FB6F199|nr:acyl-CoA dehydrogenase family protein [Saccharopolyspora gloriosae]
MPLSAIREQQQTAFREFAREEVEPHAEAWDRDETIPLRSIDAFAGKGWFGTLIPAEHGGLGQDAVAFGLLNEEIGGACSSLRSVLTVHSMVSYAVCRWGSDTLRRQWLPRLATGEVIGAFCLSEETSGNDAGALATTAVHDGETFRLTGTKKWITYGQRSDVYLVFAACDGKPAAFLVERNLPGVEVVPVRGMSGTRASMVAELHLHDVAVPASSLVGRVGFGIAAVATSALDIGRYSVAWGCVGILAAALRTSLQHAHDRTSFGVRIGEHQLVQRMVADMATAHSAARLLCVEAGELKDAGDPRTVHATWTAKYFASCQAFRAAADAVQILGARGCLEGHTANRLLRDSKVMEIIEGSTQLQQIYLAQAASTS